MPESYLTAAEVADLLKVNVDTVYALIAKQGFPATKIGGQWRFEEALVRMWFRTRGTSPHGVPPGCPETPAERSSEVKPVLMHSEPTE